MGITETAALVGGKELQWWEYLKVLGLVALALLVIVIRADLAHTPIQMWLLGVLAHIVADYNLQSNWMTSGKLNREPIPLAIHAIIAGALPVLAVGAWWPWIVISITIHYIVDWLGKDKVGGLLGDQALHLVTIVLYIA